MTGYNEIVRHPGNAALFDAVEISLLALQAGWPLHLHAEGVRGTGKTTVLRAARTLLPPLERIVGCPYNCDPARPHCPEHRHLSAAEVAALGTESVLRPFLEISHSAKLGTVVGSLDLGGLSRAEAMTVALLPGTLPQAHRGVVLVDEINRLAETAPELADVLLDAMGTRPGRVQIEEAGLAPVAVPVELVVWAASNPDEDPGPLSDVRRQLSDRFDLNVGLERPPGPEWVEQVLAVVDRRLAGESSGALDEESAVVAQQAARVPRVSLSAVRVPESVRRLTADVYNRFGLESLRAVEALHVASRAVAQRSGRTEVTRADVRRVAPLVLRHRLEPERLQRCLAFLDGTEREERQSDVRPAAIPQLALQPPMAAAATASPPAAAAKTSHNPVAAPSVTTAASANASHPLFQRVWQRLARQQAVVSGAVGRARGGGTASERGGGAVNGAKGSGRGVVQSQPGEGNDADMAPPQVARALRNVPPEQWLSGPDLWPSDV